MNASRISVNSVHNEDEDESMSGSPNKSSLSSSPEWKNTPLKALQILDSFKERLSSEPSTATNEEVKVAEEKPKQEKESPKATFVENLFFQTPMKYVIPKTEVEEEESSKN